MAPVLALLALLGTPAATVATLSAVDQDVDLAMHLAEPLNRAICDRELALPHSSDGQAVIASVCANLDQTTTLSGRLELAAQVAAVYEVEQIIHEH